jgi:hypothetical protein
MKSRLTVFFEYAALAFVILGVIYVGAYLLTVKRIVACGPTADPSKVFWVVSPDFPNRWTVALFSPALAMDRDHIRRRYWESWYVVNGTNKIFETDLLKINRRQQGQNQ